MTCSSTHVEREDSTVGTSTCILSTRVCGEWYICTAWKVGEE
jgi:hypothetical protein